jgi:hypothetical protein
VEEFDTNGSRNQGIPGEETAGGLAPALRGGEVGKERKRKGFGEGGFGDLYDRRISTH